MKQRGSNVFAGEREKLNVYSIFGGGSGEKGEEGSSTSLSIVVVFVQCNIFVQGLSFLSRESGQNFLERMPAPLCVLAVFSPCVGRKLGLPHRRTKFLEGATMSAECGNYYTHSCARKGTDATKSKYPFSWLEARLRSSTNFGLLTGIEGGELNHEWTILRER